MLGITKIPGGPHLEKLASRGDPKAYSLPLPLSNAKDLAVRNGADFSFAGLKTAVRALCLGQSTVVSGEHTRGPNHHLEN